MNIHVKERLGPDMMTPRLGITDPSCRWWVGQAILRLRREVAWQRHLGRQDPAQAALDLLRHEAAKADFFRTDPAARYLSDLLRSDAPKDGAVARLIQLAGLTEAESFVLGLALAARLDGSLGPVFALCQNDAGRPWPTLALAQAIWDEPLAVLAAGDPGGPLRRLGLLDASGLAEPLGLPVSSARYLAGEEEPEALGLRPIRRRGGGADVFAQRFSKPPDGLEIVPLVGSARADATGFIASVGTNTAVATDSLQDRLVVAWLMGADLFLACPISEREAMAAVARSLAAARDVGVRVFLHVTSRDAIAPLPQERLGPTIQIPSPDKTARAAALRAAMPAMKPSLAADIARTFRLEREEISRIGATVTKPSEEILIEACRAECSVDFHGLAEPLVPRYGRGDIVLPPAIDRQFSEAIAAIKGASRLLNNWDGDKLGDGGIPLLFAGSPGTGKTMAAEVIAAELNLPLFRIDLSQVVNKYIGETEKNLKRVFDAAEKMRCILFFDEADALFGKRSEVKDANDRFANIETGYLLQRMDNFSGVSVLATNRRKDLDEAFSRRLRYIIEFPVPGEAERRRIWQHVYPAKIDTSDLDVPFLARQFQITGGHIRSIAANAALQAAARGRKAAVTMRDVLIATRRELDKLNRKSGPDAFGRYYAEIEELRA